MPGGNQAFVPPVHHVERAIADDRKRLLEVNCVHQCRRRVLSNQRKVLGHRRALSRSRQANDSQGDHHHDNGDRDEQLDDGEAPPVSHIAPVQKLSEARDAVNRFSDVFSMLVDRDAA